MQTLKEYKHMPVPVWALSYIVNEDASGLDETDISLVDNWLRVFEDKAKELEAYVIFGIETNQELFEEMEQTLIDEIDDVLRDKDNYLEFQDVWILRKLDEVANLKKIKDEDKATYFSYKPAFGLGADVQECTIAICR